MGKTLRIGTFGLDGRSQTALQMVFKGPGKGAYELVDIESAEVAIVDIDRFDTPRLWENYNKRFPDRPAIVLSVKEQKLEGVYFQRKPVRINNLLQTLRQIAEEICGLPKEQVVPVGSTAGSKDSVAATAHSTAEPERSIPAVSTRSATRAMETRAVYSYSTTVPELARINLSDPDAQQKLFFIPKECVGGRILIAVRDSIADRAIRKITLRGESIQVFPDTRCVVNMLSDTRLKQCSMLRMTDEDSCPISLDVQKLPSSELQEDAVALKEGQDIEAFIWKMAVWISRGRVPLGTDLDAPVVLRHWPNMTRLIITPNAMRIAALWTREPHSLLNTAGTLKIPVSHVLTFYSAADAIGVATAGKRQRDSLLYPEAPSRHRRHGLLSKMLAKLRSAF